MAEGCDSLKPSAPRVETSWESPSLSSPAATRFELAPMVRISSLGFRELCASYGADIVFSEEIVAAKLATCVREVVHYPQVSSPVIEFVHFEQWKNKWKRVVVFSTLSQGLSVKTSSPELLVHPSEMVGGMAWTKSNYSSSRPLVILQLGVADPTTARRAVQVLKEGDVDGIDLNMGCPKAFSVRNGFGAALMKKTALAGAILRAMYNVVVGFGITTSSSRNIIIPPCPSGEKDGKERGGGEHDLVRISFKTRLCATAVETYQMLREVLLSAEHSPENGVVVVTHITLHARFVDQRSETPPHYELAKEVVMRCRQDALFRGIRFCLNGMLSSRRQAQEMCHLYAFDDAMLGRSALQNPTVFSPLFPVSVLSPNLNEYSSHSCNENAHKKRTASYPELVDILLEMWEYAVRYQSSFANFKYHMQRLIPEIPALKHLMPRVQCGTREYLDFLPIFFLGEKEGENSISNTRYTYLCALGKACRVEEVLVDECPSDIQGSQRKEVILGDKRIRQQED